MQRCRRRSNAPCQPPVPTTAAQIIDVWPASHSQNAVRRFRWARCSQLPRSRDRRGSRYRRGTATRPLGRFRGGSGARATEPSRLRCIDLHADLSGVCTKFQVWRGRRCCRCHRGGRDAVFRGRRRAGPNLPETSLPETIVPETIVPETSVQESNPRETSLPETGIRETRIPEAGGSETRVAEARVAETRVAQTSGAEAGAAKTRAVKTRDFETRPAEIRRQPARAAQVERAFGLGVR